MEEGSLEPRFRKHVAHALELPLNWRMQRIQTRWDVNAIDKLPGYMKLCFLAVFNMANDAGYRWVDICKSYLLEAKWYHHGRTPKLGEYLDNAWTSISGPLLLTHAYCMSDDLTEEALRSIHKYQDLARWSSKLFRLYDDLATSKVCKPSTQCNFSSVSLLLLLFSVPQAEMVRGDVPKSIQCYMHERNVSEDVAREKVRELIRVNWRGLNGDRSSSSPLEEYFKRVAINIPRMAQFVYQHGDGYGMPDGEIKTQVELLFIQPIHL
ncbi:hypothetical protein BHM03_00062899 [Ensete ventricosum]|nr:hypothetical protein BHM03_00062899 [Ensete ventricosum]